MLSKNASFIKLLIASLIIGFFGGAIGAAFSHTIRLATTLRTAHSFLIFVLPFLGLLIVFTYKKLDIHSVGTNQVLLACRSKEKLSPWLSVGIFITSFFSHLCGASVGREGAALQIGGGLSAFFSKILRLGKAHNELLIHAGMSAVFAAVFGTPFAAFFFALEITMVGALRIRAAVPCFISSFSGYFTAMLLRAHPERFTLTYIPRFSLSLALKITLITILVSLLSIIFCNALRYANLFAKSFLKNPYIRIFSGGVVIIILTLLVGNKNYNGAGVDIIEQIFESNTFHPEAFALKLIFTTISVAAGYKGGEIVPTLFIGATFGALMASLLGIGVPFGAALGMILLFCGVTNCPLASLFLSIELFSGAGVWYFLPAVALCFILSGKISLYSAQRHKFKFL